MKQVVTPRLCDIVARADNFAKGQIPTAASVKADQKPAAQKEKQKEKYCELSDRALEYVKHAFTPNQFEDHVNMDCEYYEGLRNDIEALRNTLHAELDTTINTFIEHECDMLTLYQNLKNARIVMAVECDE